MPSPSHSARETLPDRLTVRELLIRGFPRSPVGPPTTCVWCSEAYRGPPFGCFSDSENGAVGGGGTLYAGAAASAAAVRFWLRLKTFHPADTDRLCRHDPSSFALRT